MGDKKVNSRTAPPEPARMPKRAAPGVPGRAGQRGADAAGDVAVIWTNVWHVHIHTDKEIERLQQPAMTSIAGNSVSQVQSADLRDAPPDLRDLLKGLAAMGISASLPTACAHHVLPEPLHVPTSLSAAVLEERDSSVM